MYNAVALKIFTVLYHHDHYLIQKLFITKTETVYLLVQFIFIDEVLKFAYFLENMFS